MCLINLLMYVDNTFSYLYHLLGREFMLRLIKVIWGYKYWGPDFIRLVSLYEEIPESFLLLHVHAQWEDDHLQVKRRSLRMKRTSPAYSIY